MRRKIIHRVFIGVLLTFFIVSVSYAQQKVKDSMFSDWVESSPGFVVFDIRVSETPDSIIYPSFYTDNVSFWIDSIRGVKRVMIVANQEAGAMIKASSVADDGYPEDSLFYCAFSELTSEKRPVSDTVPLKYLSTDLQVPGPLSAAELYALRLSKREIQIIDVRTKSEIEQGMIPDACNIIWPDEFTGVMPKINPDVLTIVYCRSGNRASQTIAYLTDNGFSEEMLVNFGGFSKWSDYTGDIVYTPADDCQCLGVEDYIAGRDPRASNKKEDGRFFNKTSYFKEGYTACDLMGRTVKSGYNIRKGKGISSKLYLFYKTDRSGKNIVRKELLSR